MWAIRKASIRIKFQPFSSVTFHAKSETSNSSYTYKTGFNELPPHVYDRSITLKRLYSQNSIIGKHSSSSIHDATVEVVEGKNESDGEVISEADPFEYEDDDIIAQNERDLSEENNRQGRSASSGLFNAIINSPSISVKEAVDNWVEEGNDLTRKEISFAMSEFRRRRMYYRKAFELSEWLEAQERIDFEERFYASRVDLVAKLWGLQKAENYIEEKIPESFRGESIYVALLANCVVKNNVRKAEQVFNKLKKLKLPITTSACDQMLILYKRTHKTKMVDVLLFMEKENIKPSLFTYTLLVDTKGQSGDLAGMERILENMKGERLEPDFKFQAVLARHYVKLGIIEKAKTVLEEMEGDKLNERRWVCSYLLPIYASLGSLDDVKRVWEVCETDPQIYDCLSAIDAFGKLNKIDEAEAVFDKMSKIWKPLSSKQYTAMLKVYTYNKMFSEGKNLVKRINESGCGIGPDSVDALVKFYIEAEEIKELGSILNTRIKGRPFYSTYFMILEEYAKRGDVDNAETVFMRMREDGYVLRHRHYNTLLLAYINSKTPAYGFRKRLVADGIVPCQLMEARLARLDA